MNKEQVKEVSLRYKAERDDFYSKNIQQVDKYNTDLILIIKTHLYIENILDRIFVNLLPNGKTLIDLSFANKLKILSATKFAHSEELISSLSELNKIRNKFAHNVDCVLEEKDVEKLVNLLKIQKDKPIRFQLEKAIDYCIGFLHAWSALIELFPLGMTLVMNKETLFSKDKLFDKKRFSSAYDFNLLSELVTSMKL